MDYQSSALMRRHTVLRARVQLAVVGILLLGIAGMAVFLHTPSSAEHIRDIRVVARQYTYDPDTIRLSFGEWVRLRVTTADVAHSFTLPAYGINQVIYPGKETDIVMHATKKGVFAFFCDIYCGPAEGSMDGKVIVQ